MWTVDEVQPDSPDAIAMLRVYFQELIDRYNGRPMPESEVDAEMAIHTNDGVAAFFVARCDGELAGCAGLREWGALTRMYIAPRFRRRGGGRVLLEAVEGAARARGLKRLQIDTRDDLVEARGLYLAAGYEEVEPFNQDPYAEHWFQKWL